MLNSSAAQMTPSTCSSLNLKGNVKNISFKIQWNRIAVTVFLLILNQMEFHLVQNREENYHLDHIPFKLIGIGNIFFCAYLHREMEFCIFLIRTQFWIVFNILRLIFAPNGFSVGSKSMGKVKFLSKFVFL